MSISSQSSKLFATALLFAVSAAAVAQASMAQEVDKPNPQATERWAPVPPVVTPGTTVGAPPSDAIILFDGRDLHEWISAQDHTPARWLVRDGVMVVNKAQGVGNIETRRRFRDYQLHIGWRIPADIA